LLDRISIRIDSFDEIEPAMGRYKENPRLLENERKELSKTIYDDIDGQAGWRAAKAITDLLPELKKA